MTAKRQINLAEITGLRRQGKNWADIAAALNWNVSALRDRLKREGWRDPAGTASPSDPERPAEIDEADGVAIDWLEVERRLKAGCTWNDCAAAIGLNWEYLATRYKNSKFSQFEDWEIFVAKCRAAGRCELVEGVFNAALSGDKLALHYAREALKDE